MATVDRTADRPSITKPSPIVEDEQGQLRARQGISREVVAELSKVKGEPDWMAEKRLRSLEIFERKPVPSWGVDLSGLNLDRRRDDKASCASLPRRHSFRSRSALPFSHSRASPRPAAICESHAGYRARYRAQLTGNLLSELCLKLPQAHFLCLYPLLQCIVLPPQRIIVCLQFFEALESQQRQLVVAHRFEALLVFGNQFGQDLLDILGHQAERLRRAERFFRKFAGSPVEIHRLEPHQSIEQFGKGRYVSFETNIR